MSRDSIVHRNPARMIIVEDEMLIAYELRKILEQLGHSVVGIASSAEELLDLVSLLAVDLVLMDVRIRGNVDGVEAAELAQTKASVPIVYVTALADSDTLKRAADTHAFGYIVKPFSVREIDAAIRIALERSRREMELCAREARSTRLLQSIREALIVTDCDGTVQFLNAAAEQMTGFRLEEARNRPLNEVAMLKAENMSKDARAVLRGFNDSQTHTIKGTLKNRSGEEHSVSCSTSPLHEANSTGIHGTVVVIRPAAELQAA